MCTVGKRLRSKSEIHICVRIIITSENGCEHHREEASGINGEVEDGKELPQ